MKKMFFIVVLFILLFVNATALSSSIDYNEEQNNFEDQIFSSTNKNNEELFEDTTENANHIPKINTQVTFPWMLQQGDFLEWEIRIQYHGQTFRKEIPVDTTNFKDKFLKHPEYGEIVRFDVDNDLDEDVEVKVGCYWSVIRDDEGNDVKSLEKRTQFRVLPGGVSDTDASFEVWSELHVNYGLIKKSVHIHPYQTPIEDFLNRLLVKFDTCPVLSTVLSTLLTMYQSFIQPSVQPTVADDSDSFAFGSGFRSPAGEPIPRYVDKKFAFARESLFSPTIYQHSMDPGSSKGISKIELLYGYQAYESCIQQPTFDIGFSIGYDPAVYVKTKFIPKNGYVYYFFNDESSRTDETLVSFVADINEGVGEGSSLSLLFNGIDQSLACDGRWMCLDVNVANDNEPLGGSVQYWGSHQFNIDVLLDTPLFAEKIAFEQLPTLLDMSWDFDLNVKLTPVINLDARGVFDITMDKQIGSISVYYPVTEQLNKESIFLRIPQGLPRSTHLEARAGLNLDINNMQASSNYVRGHISHECSEMIPVIEAYLPEGEIDLPIGSGDGPIVKITDIPARSGITGKLYWNKLKGSVSLTRNSDGPPDPIAVQLSYGDYTVQDILEIQNGYIETSFHLADSGYFSLDTSREVLSNYLTLENTQTGDGLQLSLDAASADDFRVDWDFAGGLQDLSFDTINFNGLIDRIENLVLNLDYQGKSTSFSLDWDLGQVGTFEVMVDQEEDLYLDFSQFGMNSSTFYFDGGLTLSDLIQVDMSWKWQQGEGSGDGAVDPGRFSINKNNAVSILKNVDFVFVYMDSYGVNLTLSDLKFYLDLEWWKGDKLLPYVWLDYEVSSSEFDVDLLWTNRDGETNWHDNVEEWVTI